MRTEEAKQLIEQIQREKREKDSSDLRAALKLLAEELNTKETHFILELLQNAEDNEYGSEIPELRLSITSGNPTATPSADGCLIAQNNEIGFQPANVRSLSSVGQSTKKKDDSHGYIGEKGIGFKSVFRITDCPHIISNGFQFRFQKPTEDEPLGYLLPHWIDTVPPGVETGLTAILLPLLPGKRDLIEAQFARIAPETVLFLKKIRSLRLGANRTILSTGQAPCVSIASNGTEVSYFVQNATYAKPTDITEDKRPGISLREVTVAFPLQEQIRCTGRLFAYLPTEFDTGLPFLVNADFILNSNRERVLEDRRWNQWLRDQIAPTFVTAFLSVLENPRWQDSAHRFLPVASCIAPGADFARPVVEAIQTALKSERCVLTDERHQALPEHVVVPGALSRRLLSDIPKNRLKFALLHPSWESNWNDRLKPIGVQPLTFTQVFEACSETDFLTSRDIEWWETMFELCARCDVSAQTVGTFPLLRCRDAICRSLSDTVYSHSEDLLAAVDIPPDWPAAHLLDLELQKRLQLRPEIWKWLSKTAVLTPFSVKSYIVVNLIDWMQGQSRDQLLQATRFIARNLKQLDPPAVQTLRERMPWLLCDGKVLPPGKRGGREVITPECLEGDIGWNLLFCSLDPHFWVIHDDYCTGLSSEGLAGLRELFKACGATSLPDPRLREVKPGDHLYNETLGRCARAVSGTPTLRDWAAPGWLLGLEDVEKSPTGRQKVAALERWLKMLGPDYSKRYLYCSRSDGQGDWQQIAVWSELGAALHTKRWLRTTKGYVPPPSAFLDTPEFREFFGEYVPYILAELPPAFLEKLGVRVHLTANVLIERLREMSAVGAPDIALLGKIFRRLQDCSFDASCFAQERLIFLSEPQPRWLSVDRLVWEDAGELFDADFGYVSLTYGKSELHRFFCEILKIPERPGLRHYATAWRDLWAAGTLDRAVVERKLRIIIAHLAKCCVELRESHWWRELCPQLRVWSDRGEFRAPARVYVPDHAAAATIFADRIHTAFPPKQSGAVLAFLREIGCPSLAGAVRARLSDTTGEAVRDEHVLLTAASKELCLFLVFGRQGWQGRCELLQALHDSSEVVVEAIGVEYSLDRDSETAARRLARDAFWDVTNRRLLLRDGVDQETLRDAAAGAIAAELFGEAAGLEMQAEFFRVLTVSVERARILLEERIAWRLAPEQENWVRQQGWRMWITELEEAESASPPRGSTASPKPKGGVRAAGDAEKSAPEVAFDGRQPGATSTGKPSGQTSPGGPHGKAPEDGLENAPKDNGVEVETQELHDADSTSADFVEVRAHTRSRPRRSRTEKAHESRGGAAGGLATVSSADKSALEQRGREFAAKMLASMGYTVTAMSQMNPGFDLKAEKPGDLLKVEVKAHAGEAGTVFITQREWEEYLRTRGVRGQAWELWNVENLAKAVGSRPTIQRVRQIPKSAMKESGYWIDLGQCSSEQAK
jgi:hypothetical protein